MKSGIAKTAAEAVVWPFWRCVAKLIHCGNKRQNPDKLLIQWFVGIDSLDRAAGALAGPPRLVKIAVKVG